MTFVPGTYIPNRAEAKQMILLATDAAYNERDIKTPRDSLLDKNVDIYVLGRKQFYLERATRKALNILLFTPFEFFNTEF